MPSPTNRRPPNGQLRAPFPWFGGKSRAADLVWPRFGDPHNYVDPFAGSLAVPLLRPGWDVPAGHWLDGRNRVETVNDVDCYLANFWRALQADPQAVAHYADSPVNEADLHARHKWLVDTGAERIARLRSDPDFHDAKVAGWWVWGLCAWIGSGWCVRPEWQGRVNAARRARGIHTVWKKRPHADRGGRGVLRASLSEGPARRLPEQLPDLSGDGSAGRGIHAPRFHDDRSALPGYLRTLSERLRRVRVCVGDFERVLGPAVTTCIGVTAVFLDPPYAHSERSRRLYSVDEADVAARARAWAHANGDNPKLRIALCGYEGEHEMLPGWECVAWKAHGGYGRSARGRANSHRERIWFSPHCLRPGTAPRDVQLALLGGDE